MSLEPGPAMRAGAIFIGVLFACSAVAFLTAGEYVAAAMSVVCIPMQVSIYVQAMTNDELKAEIQRLKGEAK